MQVADGQADLDAQLKALAGLALGDRLDLWGMQGVELGLRDWVFACPSSGAEPTRQFTLWRTSNVSAQLTTPL